MSESEAERGHMCLVCGYVGLDEPAYTDDEPSYEICPSCGTEFGNDDFDASWASLRQRWIRNGARFRFPELQPPGWLAEEQLKRVMRSSD